MRYHLLALALLSLYSSSQADELSFKTWVKTNRAPAALQSFAVEFDITAANDVQNQNQIINIIVTPADSSNHALVQSVIKGSLEGLKITQPGHYKVTANPTNPNQFATLVRYELSDGLNIYTNGLVNLVY